MTDEQQIMALLEDYVRLFDAGDADGCAKLFTEDCVIKRAGGFEIRGREAWRTAVLNRPGDGRGWHRLGAVEITVNGDSANAVAKAEAEDRQGTRHLARYEDTYTRTPEGWRIADRLVVIEESHPGAPR